MTFHVYENWTIRKAAIHRSDCAHCNYGRGKRPGSSSRNGRWLGPFTTHAAALLAADDTGQPVSDCRHCGRTSAGIPGAELPQPGLASVLGERPGTDRQQRVIDLIEHFAKYVRAFEDHCPFSARQLDAHVGTLRRGLKVGALSARLLDDEFTRRLYETLREWRMDYRGAKLVPLEVFQARIRANRDAIIALGPMRLVELPESALIGVSERIWGLMDSLHVSARKSTLVSSSKALHHLLPDLVPPMDRQYTARFFWGKWGKERLGASNEARFFRIAFADCREIAVHCSDIIEPIVGRGWHTSSTKVIDNAIVGWVIENLR